MASCSELETNFSLLSEDYFGERVEDQGDSSSAEGSGSESDSSGPEEENVELELRELDEDEEEALQNLPVTVL